MTTAVLSWARSAVAPRGGTFHALQPHEIAAPIVHALLARAGLDARHVDAIVLGNALGAGGNPARMAALAAGLPERCAAFSIDSQCCAGLDAVAMAVGLIHSGQADIVIAGGVEAWSRAPIRQTRPLHPHDMPQSYERPAFAPDPADDPDLLVAACEHAFAMGITRQAQERHALLSHARATATVCPEIVPVAGLDHDAYPRIITPERAARMPVVARAAEDHAGEHACSALTISTRADAAAMVLLASERACRARALSPRARWIASASVGNTPRMPLSAAAVAARDALARAHLDVQALQAVELHDAFAVQALSFCHSMGIAPEFINRGGGGIARGHPIGASGAVALVRLLASLQARIDAGEADARRGLAAIAGAGGLGAACIVEMNTPCT